MIVIPMAGLSSRFTKEGFKKPKYMLEAKGATLFEHSISSFRHYFDSETFIFIVRDVHKANIFVKEKAKKLKIRTFEVVTLTDETRGQADTVMLGLEALEITCGRLLIFNIDTLRPNYKIPDEAFLGGGYLEVFEGDGDNWSFVLPQSPTSTIVSKTTEKEPVSNLCSSGLYFFRDVTDFTAAFKDYAERPKETWAKNELYVAPLYNELINRGIEIHYHLIQKEDVIFYGIPSEFYEFKNGDLDE